MPKVISFVSWKDGSGEAAPRGVADVAVIN